MAIVIEESDKQIFKILTRFTALSTNDLYRLVGKNHYDSYNNCTTRLRQLAGVRECRKTDEGGLQYTKSGRLKKYVPPKGKYLICKPYGEMFFGAEKREGLKNKITALYTLTKAGMRALSRGDENPPEWKKNLDWMYYHRSKVLADLVDGSIPVDKISTPQDYKRRTGIRSSVPMSLKINFPESIYLLTFLSYKDAEAKGKSQKFERVYIAINFSRSLSQRSRNETYVILVPDSMYNFVLSELLEDVECSALLLRYKDAGEALSGIYQSPDYFTLKLADYMTNYLGATDLMDSAYGSPFHYDIKLNNGERVYLYDYMSGNIDMYRLLQNNAKTINAPVYCLARRADIPYLPVSPYYKYIAYEDICVPSGQIQLALI